MPLPGRQLLAASVMACACVDGSTAATVPDSPWPPASSSSSAGTPPEGGDAVECEELAAPPDTVTPLAWTLPTLDLTDESCDSTRLDYSDCGAGCYEYYNSWETTVVDADGRTRWEEQDRYSPFRTSYIYDDAWRLTAAYIDEGAGSEVYSALAYGYSSAGWLAEERQQEADGSASAIVWWESDSEGREVWDGADRDVD